MAPSPESDPRSPTRAVRLRKILVIDRDAFWGPAIRMALEESGYYPNLVVDAREGCRRSMERVYDGVIVSASLGQAAVWAILDTLSRRTSPPAAVVLAGADDPESEQNWARVPCLWVLHRPYAVEDVVDAARALVGVPWSDHRKGA